MLQRFTIPGYGTFEANTMSGRTVESDLPSQAKVDPAQFTKTAPVENGMWLAYDIAHMMLKLPSVDNGIATERYAVIGSNEATYDPMKSALHDYAGYPIDNIQTPRGYTIKSGNVWTSDTFVYDDVDFTNDAAVITALGNVAVTPLYLVPCTLGAPKLTATAPPAGVPIVYATPFTTPTDTFAIQARVQ